MRLQPALATTKGGPVVLQRANGEAIVQIAAASRPVSAQQLVIGKPTAAPSSHGLIPPPSSFGPAEPAVKHVYDFRTKAWTKTDIMVALNPTPFQEGTLRVIFHLKDFSLPDAQQGVVGKVSKDPNEPSRTYFMDVEMQGTAKAFAEQFNARRPPKTIDFVLPWVIEFKSRTGRNGRGRLYMGVEPYLFGKYQKHSNNYGFVSPEDRNTPQAFSHFSYHMSSGKMLVCDIQGVGDIYTDPQIHTGERAHRWGKADMGPEGIRQFFKTHRCSAICEFLRLPAYGPKKKVDLSTALGGGHLQPQQVPVPRPITAMTSPTRQVPEGNYSDQTQGGKRVVQVVMTRAVPTTSSNDAAQPAVHTLSPASPPTPLGDVVYTTTGRMTKATRQN